MNFDELHPRAIDVTKRLYALSQNFDRIDPQTVLALIDVVKKAQDAARTTHGCVTDEGFRIEPAYPELTAAFARLEQHLKEISISHSWDEDEPEIAVIEEIRPDW